MITRNDIYRFRKQRGVNLGMYYVDVPSESLFVHLGSWFVLEKWITGRPFAISGGSCDLDVGRHPNGKSILEHHWDTWITTEDWMWIDERGLNSVRIPVSHISIPRVLVN